MPLFGYFPIRKWSKSTRKIKTHPLPPHQCSTPSICSKYNARSFSITPVLNAHAISSEKNEALQTFVGQVTNSGLEGLKVKPVSIIPMDVTVESVGDQELIFEDYKLRHNDSRAGHDPDRLFFVRRPCDSHSENTQQSEHDWSVISN